MGIGSGKTTASDEFARLGADVIDTDLLSRALVELGTAGTRRDRRRIRAIGARRHRAPRPRSPARADFADPQARRQLEDILHPEDPRSDARTCRTIVGTLRWYS